ncbi:MAG: FlgD immunoglobulin-like domain containing protein [Candidatus Krumholzibacteriia bacterium]
MKRLAILAIVLTAAVVRPTVASAENHWHVSAYRAESIEGHGPGNHALYCGDETIPACAPPDTIGGVGPGWNDDVEWRASVADPRRPATIRLTGLLNYDLADAGWDFLELYVQRGDQLDLLESWTGSYGPTVALDITTVLADGEFSGPGSNEVRLVWRVRTSDDGWDDADCLNPSHGACQIDDLSVYVDAALVTFDDFEPGNPVAWTPVDDAITAAGEAPGAGQLVVAAHPNPFNPRTTISYDLPRAAVVSLAVYDLQGRLVRVLAEPTRQAAGRHQQAWDGQDALGQAVGSGIYFYRLVAGQESRAGKLTVLK